MTQSDKHFVELRAADEAECRAGGFASGGEALAYSWANSTNAFAHERDGDILAYWGFREIGTVLGGTLCVAWMLSTPHIEQHRMHAARESRRLVDALLDHYGEIYVVVDCEYELALKWLRWLGFNLYGRDGRMMAMRAVRSMN